MNIFLLSSIVALLLLTNTGCTSTPVAAPLTLIEQQEHQTNKQLNNKVLASIESLRSSPTAISKVYTFSYTRDNKELSYRDKMTIIMLLIQKKHIVINIAPAKGTDKLQQLKLSLERAKVLRQYITGFTEEITITFSPELATNTVNVIVGA